MMTQQDKKRYETYINIIDAILNILHKDYGSSFILSICTRTGDKDNATVHSGCNCTFEEAIVMFDDLAEEDSNITKTMGLFAKHTERKNN